MTDEQSLRLGLLELAVDKNRCKLGTILKEAEKLLKRIKVIGKGVYGTQ